MNLTKEQLQEVEELALLPGLTDDEIAIICGIDTVWFSEQLKLPDSDIFKAYNKGQLLSKSQLAKKIKLLSDQGSGPAQALQEKLLRQSKIQNLFNEYAKSERQK
jgi:hypothetical protein